MASGCFFFLDNLICSPFAVCMSEGLKKKKNQPMAQKLTLTDYMTNSASRICPAMNQGLSD